MTTVLPVCCCSCSVQLAQLLSNDAAPSTVAAAPAATEHPGRTKAMYRVVATLLASSPAAYKVVGKPWGEGAGKYVATAEPG